MSSEAPVSGNPLDLLSDRTLAVFRLKADGRTLRAIGAALGISRSTVRNHLRRARMILTPVAEAVEASGGVRVARACFVCRIRPKRPGESTCSQACANEYRRSWRARERAAGRRAT